MYRVATSAEITVTAKYISVIEEIVPWKPDTKWNNHESNYVEIHSFTDFNRAFEAMKQISTNLEGKIHNVYVELTVIFENIEIWGKASGGAGTE